MCSTKGTINFHFAVQPSVVKEQINFLDFFLNIGKFELFGLKQLFKLKIYKVERGNISSVELQTTYTNLKHQKLSQQDTHTLKPF